MRYQLDDKKENKEENKIEKSLDDFIKDNAEERKEKEIKEKIFNSQPYNIPNGYLENLIMDNYLPKDYNKDGFFGKFSNTLVELLPRNTTIKRVPQHVLGPYVLGRAFIGINIIDILDTLYGTAYEAVLDHEAYHVLHPDKPESKVRERTRILFPGFFSMN